MKLLKKPHNSSKIQKQKETNKNQQTPFLFCLFFFGSGFDCGLKKARCPALMAEGGLGAEVPSLQEGRDVARCSQEQSRRGNGEHQGAGRYLGDMLLVLLISWSDLLFLAFYLFFSFLTPQSSYRSCLSALRDNPGTVCLSFCDSS